MNFDVALHGITIGSFTIRFYALALLTGMLMGIVLARREARRWGEDPEHVVNIAVLGAALGLVGARLYHVFDQQWWPYFRANPEQIILGIRSGGLGIFGAMAGAVLALAIYVRWKRMPMLRWLDIGAPAFLLGQALGRWGNFFNQELYGPPSDLPWAFPISLANRVSGYEGFERFHPLFLYESLLSLLGVAALLYVARRFGPRLRAGDIVLLYFIWYPAERFALEFLRLDPWTQGGIPMAQWLTGASVLLAAAMLVWRHRRPRPAAEVQEPHRRSRSAVRRQRRRSG